MDAAADAADVDLAKEVQHVLGVMRLSTFLGAAKSNLPWVGSCACLYCGWQLITIMDDRNTYPDHAILSSAIRAATSAGHVCCVRACMHVVCGEKKCQVTAVLTLPCRSPLQVQQAAQYLQDMREWGISPELLDYERCVRSACKVGLWCRTLCVCFCVFLCVSVCFCMFACMPVCEPDAWLVQRGDTALAESLVGIMHEDGVQKTPLTWRWLVHGYLMDGDVR